MGRVHRRLGHFVLLHLHSHSQILLTSSTITDDIRILNRTLNLAENLFCSIKQASRRLVFQVQDTKNFLLVRNYEDDKLGISAPVRDPSFKLEPSLQRRINPLPS